MLELYRKLVLPWRKRAEEAEAVCELQKQVIDKLMEKTVR